MQRQIPTALRHLLGATLAALAFGAAAQHPADPAPVKAAVDEAVAVHAIATAARLCNQITEQELTHALTRMDRVHGAQLDERGRETYLIVRGSEGFRNTVFASALRRAQGGGCAGEVVAVWRDIHASLVLADMAAASRMADAGVSPTTTR